MNFATLAGDKFNKGDIVQIHELKQQSKLNQSFAIVVSDGINAKNRYEVKSNHNLYAIKSINMTAIWPDKLDQIFGINEDCHCVFCEKAIPSNCLGKHSCPGCQIMVYCSRKCQKQHKFLPSKMLKGTHPSLFCQKYQMVMKNQFPSFLQRFNAISCALEKVNPSGDPFWQLPDNDAKLSIWKEEQYGMDRAQGDSIMKSWTEWYNFHGTPHTNVISRKYHNVMTIYWILIKMGLTPKTRRDIVVHLVGVEGSELNDMDEFQELRVLLPFIRIIFICFAPTMAGRFEEGTFQLTEGIKFLVFTRHYNEANIKLLMIKKCAYIFCKLRKTVSQGFG